MSYMFQSESLLEMLKRRGKGPPKKGQGRRAAKRINAPPHPSTPTKIRFLLVLVPSNYAIVVVEGGPLVVPSRRKWEIEERGRWRLGKEEEENKRGREKVRVWVGVWYGTE
ncbi:hypothetical protein V8G54_009693 [Vigna mungo]|uniref:Uncharacterized protein n=1 Tax=Vigna mungo TaxID=3915 RepID=A0AAQ3S5Q8_VIGMU